MWSVIIPRGELKSSQMAHDTSSRKLTCLQVPRCGFLGGIHQNKFRGVERNDTLMGAGVESAVL